VRCFEGNPKEGLLGATLGFFVGFAAVALFGSAAVQFKELMQLSPVMLGLLVAIPCLSGSLLRIPFSAWVDTTGGRKPFLVLLVCAMMGMLGLFFVLTFLPPSYMTAQFYPVLLMLGLLCGCGIALFSVGISQVSYWYPQKEQGYVLGVYAGVGNLAPGIFAFLLPVALLHWDLSGAYLAWFLFLTAGTVLYFKLGRNAWYFQLLRAGASPENAKLNAREQGQEIFPSGDALQSLTISAKIWKTWVLVGIYFTTFGGFIALTAWLPTYWTQGFGVTAVAAGILTATYSILASLIRVFGGKIADRFGGEKTALLSLLITLAGAVILTRSDVLLFSVCGVILLAVGMGSTNAAVFKLVPQEVPQAVGGAAGWVGGLGAFGGFVIPPAMAVFVSWYGVAGYARGFLVFDCLVMICLGLALLLIHQRKLHEEEPREVKRTEVMPEAFPAGR